MVYDEMDDRDPTWKSERGRDFEERKMMMMMRNAIGAAPNFLVRCLPALRGSVVVRTGRFGEGGVLMRSRPGVRARLSAHQ